MNILVVSLEASKVYRPEILSWFAENGCGVNHNRYWILRVDAPIMNPEQDYEIHKLMALLHLCKIHNYQSLMIKKYV